MKECARGIIVDDGVHRRGSNNCKLILLVGVCVIMELFIRGCHAFVGLLEDERLCLFIYFILFFIFFGQRCAREIIIG